MGNLQHVNAIPIHYLNAVSVDPVLKNMLTT